ncbi:hypothetical protein CJF30_00011207 [Rutstroemia sp. NJR-2017a BBW]|nr:hypothetical protein CJF30_00011207 [Rutstroemia sp. NJR-2017a BBW]
MFWGMIGWDYKSPLVFLERQEGDRGVTSKTYLQQVLEPIVFPLFDQLGTDYIFMEDDLKQEIQRLWATLGPKDLGITLRD